MLTPNDREFLQLKNPATIGACWLAVDDPMLVSTSLSTLQKEKLVIRACAYVNGFTKRFFNSQIADYIQNNAQRSTRYLDTIVLPNNPVSGITDAYIQILAKFTEISLDYLELQSDSGIIRLLTVPEGLINIQSVVPYQFEQAQLWIRYTSGYTSVPEDVVQATALVYNHLYTMSQDTSAVRSFETQNYKQTNATPSESPMLLSAHQLLNPYRKTHVA